MKRTVRLNEQDINRIVGECVRQTLNEKRRSWEKNHFWDNLRAGISAGKTGYNASREYKEKQDWYDERMRRNIPQDPNAIGPGEGYIDSNYRIAKYIREIYEIVGWLSNDWNNYGNHDGRTNSALEKRLNEIEIRIKGIKKQLTRRTVS